MKNGVALMADSRIDFTNIQILPGTLIGPIVHYEHVLFCQKEPHGRAHNVKVSIGTARDKEVFFGETLEAFLTPSSGPYSLILELADPRCLALSGAGPRWPAMTVAPHFASHAQVSRMTSVCKTNFLK